MTSPDPSTYHPGELDLLIGDLAGAGFRPVGGDRHRWRGPIRDSLSRLTPTTSMLIEIRDGWPYLHPYLFADGLAGRKHVNADGNVCLWPEDDDGYSDWARLEPILARIDAWVADQEAGVAVPALDAHLYTGMGSSRMVLIDIDGLLERKVIRRGPGSSGLLRARLEGDVYRVGASGNLNAAWFWLAGLAAPPTDAARIPELLDLGQKRTFNAMFKGLRRSRSCPVVLLWEDAGQLNAFGAEIRRSAPARHAFRPLEVARTDPSVLRLRSGPDAPRLGETTVTVFGLGAIGSEIAMLLARSGVRRLILVDQERLRPANLTRHSASGRAIGLPKSVAVATTITEALPDTRVTPLEVLVWKPDNLAFLAGRSALFVEAAGNRAYRELLSRVCADADIPLVAVALHRAGRIARVRVQATKASPLWMRASDPAFPEVPADPAVPMAVQWETGCGAPVNNAPPVAVASAAALAARCALHVLTGRHVRNRDLLDIYDPISEVPFHRPGLLEFEAR